MTTIYIVGGVVVVAVFFVWLAINRTKAGGAAEKAARDAALAREAEQEMAKIVAERRDTAETRKRLDEDTF